MSNKNDELRKTYAIRKRGRKLNGERWDKRNPEKARQYRETWREKNRLKTRAHDKLNNAIKSGKLIRGKCKVCGSSGAHGHHKDYLKPLIVTWLCEKHHKTLHRKY